MTAPKKRAKKLPDVWVVLLGDYVTFVSTSRGEAERFQLREHPTATVVHYAPKGSR